MKYSKWFCIIDILVVIVLIMNLGGRVSYNERVLRLWLARLFRLPTTKA
jgi:hypothetical protein